MIEELIAQDFETFKSGMNNLPILYHCTTKEGAEGIVTKGCTREFTGKNSNFYGQGFYTTFTLDSTLDNSQGYVYGKYIIKFVLNNGFKDFLFFDEEMNEKYNNGEDIRHQINRLCPPEVVNKLENGGFFNTLEIDYGQHKLLNKPLTAGYAKTFFEILKGERLSNDKLTPWQIENNCRLFDEKLISQTKVRGYIFVGNNDGEVCVVRDFNDLIPIELYDPTTGEWTNILQKDLFDDISDNMDVGVNIRGEYPETSFNAKTICGYILVKGKPSGKYNYVKTDTLEELLPVPADYATDFDPETKMCKFIINGEQYIYSIENDMFYEDGFAYDRDEFKEEMLGNNSLNENVNKIISLIERINSL